MISRASCGLLAAGLALGGLWLAATPAAGQTAIFHGDFETGDCIPWDQLVGGCMVDAVCPTELRFFAVCEIGTNTCIECFDSSDCLSNPTALGPTCSANLCGCSSSTECAANPAGPVCDAGAGVCTCETSLDCVPPQECRATPYLGGLTTCW